MKINKWLKYTDIQDILNVILVICTLLALIFSVIILFAASSATALICLYIPVFIVYAVQNAVMEWYIYHVDEYDLKALHQVLHN